MARSPETDVKRTTSDIQTVGAERKINSAPAVSATATKDHASTPVEPDLRRTVCKDGACQQPAPKPVQLKPVGPDVPHKVCKDGPCQACPAGQLAGKDGACAAPPRVVKNGNVPGVGSARNAVQQPCPAGQLWDGAQCAVLGAQRSQDCTIAIGGAQNVIVELRSARQEKDDACLRNPTGRECQEAEAHYDLMLNEYRNFLGGVPAECQTALPDPIAI